MKVSGLELSKDFELSVVEIMEDVYGLEAEEIEEAIEGGDIIVANEAIENFKKFSSGNIKNIKTEANSIGVEVVAREIKGGSTHYCIALDSTKTIVIKY